MFYIGSKGVFINTTSAQDCRSRSPQSHIPCIPRSKCSNLNLVQRQVTVIPRTLARARRAMLVGANNFRA